MKEKSWMSKAQVCTTIDLPTKIRRIHKFQNLSKNLKVRAIANLHFYVIGIIRILIKWLAQSSCITINGAKVFSDQE